MKKALFTILLVFVSVLNANAVLKEKDLGHTIHVLRLELYNQWMRQKELIKMMEANTEKEHEELINYIERSNTASLMLYSQGYNFTFDVAYACQEATKLYYELHRKKKISFSEIRTNLESEITRYDSLINALRMLPPAMSADELSITEKIVEHDKEGVDHSSEGHHHSLIMLSKQGQEDRRMCIKYAETLRDNIKNMLHKFADDNEHREQLAKRIGEMNKYAEAKYQALQQSIFVNPGESYFSLLFNINRHWKRIERDFNQKYQPLKEKKGNSDNFLPYHSEWRGSIVLFSSVFMLIYMLGAAILSNVILRWVIPSRIREKENYKKKRPTLIVSGAIFIFLIAVMIARHWMVGRDLMMMASNLMIQMAWLMGAISISILIRLDNNQIQKGARLYNPFIIMSLIVICFRIVLIPNTLVNFIFPPILLFFTIWQISTLKACRNEVPMNDKICCSISLFVMVTATILSWIGFPLMAVQILVWWMFQLAAIATITCIYDLMEMYEDRFLLKRIKKEHRELSDKDILRKMKRGDFVSKTWIYDFFNRALLPVCAVYSILLSVILAANIFNLNDLCFTWFMHKFTLPGTEGQTLISISAFRLSLVVALYFIFKYLNYLARSAWFGYRRSTGKKNFNATLARNIIGIVSWGLYIIICFMMLKVPATGIAVVTGGLSTGLGFASKSLLENFFYGISLMSGRVRVGDYIECDGITGKVESITYQSTQIITLDGSVVAILNSDLFSKNFKNLTRNHEYVLVNIPVGVAYGTNINKVREMLVNGLQKLCVATDDGRNTVRKETPISVAFNNFGDSSVDLLVKIWVLVDQKLPFVAKANETIYEILNENNIEIPFPQRDIHMRSE